MFLGTHLRKIGKGTENIFRIHVNRCNQDDASEDYGLHINTKSRINLSHRFSNSYIELWVKFIKKTFSPEREFLSFHICSIDCLAKTSLLAFSTFFITDASMVTVGV